MYGVGVVYTIAFHYTHFFCMCYRFAPFLLLLAGSNSNSERDDELVKALRAQLAMTQDLVASTRAELDSQAKEQNDLRETAAAAAGAARHATGRAQVHGAL